MTLRHLKIFVTVADCGKMSLAAEMLYISQPAVSQAIRELERHYDVRLFERLSQKLYLTEAGQLLLPRARHILDAFDTAENDLLSQGLHPILRVGASVTVGTCLIPHLAALLEAQIPGVDMRITVNNTGAVEAEICTSTLDLALVEGEVYSPDLIQEPLWEDELILTAGPGHPLCGHPVTLHDLDGQALIARESGSADRNQFERYLNGQGVTMVKKWSISGVEPIRRLAAQGRGVAILSRRLVVDELARGELLALDLRREDGSPLYIRRSFKLIYHRDKYLSPAMERFAALCRAEAGHSAVPAAK